MGGLTAAVLILSIPSSGHDHNWWNRPKSFWRLAWPDKAGARADDKRAAILDVHVAEQSCPRSIRPVPHRDGWAGGVSDLEPTDRQRRACQVVPVIEVESDATELWAIRVLWGGTGDWLTATPIRLQIVSQNRVRAPPVLSLVGFLSRGSSS